MGISPYYRGTDCNFWATYDNNPELVGATIYLLSSGLDDGKILFHTFPKKSNNYFIFSMRAVKSAFECLIKNIKNKKLLKIKPINQNKKSEIRYSKISDFTDEVLEEFNNKKINLKIKKRNLKKFVNSFNQ
jgi:methionyl-tRNA formyltransferase